MSTQIDSIAEIKFLVQGSADAPYSVEFRKAGDNLTANCTCPAGVNGQYCKHRFNILGGLTDGIVSGNCDAVEIVNSWLAGTDVDNALTSLMDAEEKFEQAKVELSRAKKKLARVLND